MNRSSQKTGLLWNWFWPVLDKPKKVLSHELETPRKLCFRVFPKWKISLGSYSCSVKQASLMSKLSSFWAALSWELPQTLRTCTRTSRLWALALKQEPRGFCELGGFKVPDSRWAVPGLNICSSRISSSRAAPIRILWAPVLDSTEPKIFQHRDLGLTFSDKTFIFFGNFLTSSSYQLIRYHL